jgi:oxidase EvaA
MPNYCYQRHEQGVACAYCGGGGMVVDVKAILDWLEVHRQDCRMAAEKIRLCDIERWGPAPWSGDICHDTGEFYRVIGIRVSNADFREVASWCQPMIEQREMGILGLLVQKQGDVDRYLVQAKAEPGNVGKVLVSPTLQSTVSNLKQAHGGKKSRWASFFEDPIEGSVVYDRHQAEDGGRFYLKTNRNMIVRVPEGIDLQPPNIFLWVTLGEIKQLLQYENVVNVAVRSIISAIW